ncbi:hypothetical protein FG379_002573, partial [Cryptosporidium bovis]|uniref:uncharacterized protein n=1 Tax=Cryptosporidium bovis TaxID=310047 RepID=UPI00351A89D3
MPSCYTEIGNNVYLNEDEDSELMKIIEFSVDNGSDNEIKTIIDDESNTSYMNECLLFNTSSEIIECKLNSSDNNKRVKLPGVVSNKEFIQNILSGYNNDDNNEFNPNKSNVTFNNNPNSDSRNNNLFCEERYEYSENTNESHFVESIVLLDDNLDFNFNKENNRKQVNNIPSFSTGTGKKVVINDESMKKAGKLVFGEELTFGDDN